MVWTSYPEGAALEIDSVLLAAGRGTRLRPLSDKVAKPAVPVLDVPLGAFGLARLVADAAPVIVNVSHLPHTVIGALGDVVAPDRGWSAFREGASALGTAGTLAALADRVGPVVVVYNGDLLSDISPAAVLEGHRDSGARATVVVRPVAVGADLALEGDRVTGFIDRRDRGDAEGALYLGVAVLDRDVVRAIPNTPPLGLGESVLAELATRGELSVWRHDGYALDIGTPARYLGASLELLHGRGPEPPVSWPGEIVAVEGGLAYVGPGSEVDVSSLRDGAVVLRGAMVESGAVVARSIVWPHERVPAGTVLENVIWFDGTALTV